MTMRKHPGYTLKPFLFLLMWDRTLSFHNSQPSVIRPSSSFLELDMSGGPCDEERISLEPPVQNLTLKWKGRERSKTNAFNLDRDAFLRQISACIFPTTAAVTGIASFSVPTEAIEFVPASPSYQGTYQDAMEILSSQRLAVDNISEVISNGNLDEAGFKAMQLSVQIRTAGKIVLDSFQERSSARNSANLLRFLACQKKFVTLLDLCDEFSVTLVNSMAGKLGVVSVAQIKLIPVLDEVKNAYDDFLLEINRDE